MDQPERKKTRVARVGKLIIGETAPVSIQSMTNTRPHDYDATLAQIKELAEAGADLVRVAVPDKKAVPVFKKLAENCPLPLVGDIHFDPELAFLALDNGAAKIRINPGNIGGTKSLEALALKAKNCNAAIRIGVNAGSLERRLLQKYRGATAEAMVDSAAGYLEIFKNVGFNNLVVSLKASDVYTTIKANRLFSKDYDYPLHLGVTEAGPPSTGLLKGAIGIGALLADGIGDTIRVSLTASPLEEIKAAKKILQALGIRLFTPELISCPTCGRCEIDLVPLVNQVEVLLEKYKAPLKVAVMGCAVNGPGEAKEADIGISAGKKKGILFRYGKVVRTVEQDKLLEALKEELNSY